MQYKILKKQVKKFFVLPPNLKFLLIEALVLFLKAKIILLLLPAKKVLMPSISDRMHVKEPVEAELSAIRWALLNVSLFFSNDSQCLTQCIAARWMLNRRGVKSQLLVGVRHSENGQIITHAWLKAGNYEIITQGEDYKVLSRF